MKKGITNTAPSNESSEKSGTIEYTKDGRRKTPNMGGARKGAGAKKKEDREVQRTLTEIAEAHANEVVDVQIINKTTNTTETVQKTRSEAILDMLYTEAVNRKNIPAAKEYHDRTRGKAKQEIEHSGEIKTETQRPPTMAELEAAKAYESNL